MQYKPTILAPALQALLEKFIDYAGVFPPASLTLDAALNNYQKYRQSQYAWMLRSFVVAQKDLHVVPESFDGSLAVLADVDNSRAASIESRVPVAAGRPVYCEVKLDQLEQLANVKQAGCFAKIRTGGITADVIPDTAEVARFIDACAELRLPFKATAGLHHPVRSEYALTYESNAPRAVLHGFLNVAMASALSWAGHRRTEEVLAERDPSAFQFAEQARWRDLSLDLSSIRDARTNFIHSIGSCSFTEPVYDLRDAGLL